MRILILNWRDPTHPWAGGAETYLYELSKRWIDKGHKVTWFSSKHPTQAKSDTLSGLEYFRKGGFFSVYPIAPIYYSVHFAGRFDVIIDSANGIPFFSPMYSATPKISLIHHVHKQVFYCELPRYLAHIAAFIELIAAPVIYRNTQFITVSDSSRRALIDLGIHHKQIEIIFNGVDCDMYRPGRKSDTPLLLYLGRLRFYKSIDTVIHALPHLARSFPKIQLSIAGSGPAKSDLKSLAHELGVSDKVKFHGYVSENEKIALLQKAHVVVNPSLKEGWGLTVLEANACGTPVIGADVPGLRDSINHGTTGLLVPHGDSEALAIAAYQLLSDQNRRRSIGESAREWALKYDWEVSATKCMTIMEKVINGNHR